MCGVVESRPGQPGLTSVHYVWYSHVDTLTEARSATEV